MDRSWMSKPRQDTAYQDGVEQFLTFAYGTFHVIARYFVLAKMQNRLNHSHDEVRTHLRCDGIIQGYTTWVHHGEMYESPQFAFVDVPTDTTNLPTSGVSRAPAVQDGMQELLQAAFFRNEMFESLPSMSEGVVDVELGFADMEQTVAEDVHPADDNAKESEQNLYERYLKDAHTSLYPGCKFSKLSFLVNLYYLKFLNGWTQESFTRLLEEVRPGGPAHYYRGCTPWRDFLFGLKALVKNELSQKVRLLKGNMKDMYMFESAGEPIGKATVSHFDSQLLIQAHRYVLRHCDELEEFRKEFVDEEKGKSCPSTTLILASIDKLIDQHFPDWLEQKVILGDGLGITKKVRALAAKPSRHGVRYSGYIINGFRFHTLSREAARSTQNSGVVNIAEDGVNYYGRLTDIIELTYTDYKAVLFKCDWYDVHHRAGLRNDEFGLPLVNFSKKIHTGEKLEHYPCVFSS
ncbi:unnamed protein product [Miscanthus lutarioriparius]|uniref:DUF4216 domain-containing protein n=1 Tax=Miscanthus lutarioriparius TaxID=422564 RepID=A0A811QZR8_9POAL|nr:unnamed protein product [Miscanthus lutarioriparius]